MIFVKALFTIIFLLGLGLRLYVSIHFQSRAWIDELWVVLDPAYKLLTGVGELQGVTDWMAGTRSWVPPGILFLYLKFLTFLGFKKGTIVLPLVRATSAVALSAGYLAFSLALKQHFKLKLWPILPLFILMLIPELIHFDTTADLSVFAMPFLLFGLSLILFDLSPSNFLSPSFTWKSYIGSFLLCLSALIRFQYGVFPACMLLYFYLRHQKNKMYCLLAMGIFLICFDVALNSQLYGFPHFPLWTYFKANTVGGVASSYGTSPFYFAFELLWRFATEPVFFLILITLPLYFKQAPVLAVSSLLFFIIHVVVGHKEYRFFYGSVVLLSSLSAAAFQRWIEQKWDSVSSNLTIAALCSFLVLFVGVGTWRAQKKVNWNDYTVPSSLETYAGTLPDIRGLLSYGWGGIYSGAHYTFYNKAPYHYAENLSQLKEKKLNPNDYNYVVTSNHQQPCSETILVKDGATLFRCTTEEITNLILP